MNLIPNYSLNGFSNDGNVVSAVRVDSSVKLRFDATYSRTIPTFNQGNGIYSVPVSQMVVRRDVANADGNPSGQRASARAEFRLPVASTEADLDALLLDFRAYVNDPDLKASILQQLLPMFETAA